MRFLEEFSNTVNRGLRCTKRDMFLPEKKGKYDYCGPFCHLQKRRRMHLDPIEVE